MVIVFIEYRVLTFDLIRPGYSFIDMGEIIAKELLSLVSYFLYVKGDLVLVFLLLRLVLWF